MTKKNGFGSRLHFECLAERLNGSIIDTNKRDYFQASFGVSSKVASIVWRKITHSDGPSLDPIHLLWALLFLKVYPNERVLSGIVGADRKTVRSWVWHFIYLMAALKKEVVSRSTKNK